MKLRHSFFFWILFGFTFWMTHSSFLFLDSNKDGDFTKIKYQIKTSSLLTVNGTTNINSFSCTSLEKFSNNNLSYKIEAGTPFIHFENTFLKIKIKQLDCGKKPINKDLHKTLQANKYPNIIIKLNELSNLECDDLSECNSWVDFEANTDITIGCQTQSTRIPIQVKMLDTNNFRIIGGSFLQLCDFEIEPPTALLGLIKVEDKIEIDFDLFVELE